MIRHKGKAAEAGEGGGRAATGDGSPERLSECLIVGGGPGGLTAAIPSGPVSAEPVARRYGQQPRLAKLVA